jgi:hypothetical protein
LFTTATVSCGQQRRRALFHLRPQSLLAAKGEIMEELLLEFAPLFQEPSGLPPSQNRTHCIHLLRGTTPIAVRPYLYAHAQKAKLKQQCAAMLQSGIIHPSSSAFSTPVLLVKKSDASWRFCVDYRALNERTVKDKFPILVVEELLGELRGTCFFSKIDLRSSYYQILMHTDDVAKTAFRTHQGLFEFLIMSFDSTNAPATFQALMNDVLQSYLHRFVLVFFDDILVYSRSWSEHLQHVRLVLNTLKEHHLFMKRTKCAFGRTKISYLGHVISVTGVAMD